MKKITPKKLVDIVQKNAWFIQGFNGLPLYLHNVASMTGWMTKPTLKATYSHFFLRMHESRAHWYYDELDLQKIGEVYYKRVKSISGLLSLEQKHKASYFKAVKITGNFTQTGLSKLSLKELCSLAEKLVNELAMSVNLAHMQEGISFVSEQKLKQILQKRGISNSEYYQLLSAPVKPSFLSEVQTALGKIKTAKNSHKQKLVAEFIKDFGWMDNSYVRGKILTPAEVLEKSKHKTHAGSAAALKQTQTKKAKLIKLLTLTPEEIFVVKTIEITTKWQDTRKKFIMQTIGRFEPVVEELARRLRLTPQSLKYITPWEVNYKNLSDKKFIQMLKDRYPRCSYYALEHTILSFPKKDYWFIEKKVAKNNSGAATEIKGSIANKGKVRGRVRVCQTIHDIPKVLKGEILVASMTRPEFLPAMQKAAAFVTDEGGITSHAAIISREMNKPCIIGTKIATQVLKNGDLVEVDANMGTVKIIKR